MLVPGIIFALFFALSLATPVIAEQDLVKDSSPKIYKWIDENGIAHYTTDVERIPSILRNKIGRQLNTEDEGTKGEPPISTSRRESLDERGFAKDAILVPLNGDLEEWDAGVGNANSEILADLDKRINTLEIEIAADEEALKLLISSTSTEGGPTQEQTVQFREVSTRLPKLLTELTTLRGERGQLAQ